MDRPLKDAERKLLAQALVSRAPELERYGANRRQDFLEGIELLKTLEPIARQTLAPEVAEAAQAQSRSAVAETSKSSQTPAMPASAHAFSSREAAYRPALKDPGVVEALLAFHRKAAPSVQPQKRGLQARLDQANAANPHGAPPASRAQPASSPPKPAQAPRGFQASTAPRVEAGPKPQATPTRSQRNTGNRILRSDGN